jgi:peptide/nickel transport system permease protein
VARIRIVIGRRPKAAIGGGVLFVVMLATVFAPVLTRDNPIRGDLTAISLPPVSGHPLGTDDLGRDVLARLLYGGRYTLGLSVLSAVAAVALGLLIGVSAGYYEGWYDAATMRVNDVLLAFPVFLLALALMAALGPGLFNIVLVLAVSRAPRYARLMRGVVLQQKALEYVLAARATGATDSRVLFRHVIPNCVSTGMVYATFDAGTMLTALAGLSFLGVGVQPPTPDWGLMLTDARTYIYSAPWAAVFPGLAITICVMGVNFLGDGLRDLLDPRMRRW